VHHIGAMGPKKGGLNEKVEAARDRKEAAKKEVSPGEGKHGSQ